MNNTHSEDSLRRNISMAAENAANARPPPNAALGPELRARMAPVTNTPAMGLTMSYFARYY